MWKAAYHLPRALLKIMLLFEQQKPEPATARDP